MNTSGDLLVRVIGANLTRSTEMLAKMSPYVRLQFASNDQTTNPHKGGGKTPQWNQSFNFFVTPADQNLRVTVMDKDMFKDDIVAQGDIPVGEVYQARQIERDYPLQYQGKPAGTIRLGFIYTPKTGGSSIGGAGWNQGQIGIGQTGQAGWNQGQTGQTGWNQGQTGQTGWNQGQTGQTGWNQGQIYPSTIRPPITNPNPIYPSTILPPITNPTPTYPSTILPPITNPIPTYPSTILPPVTYPTPTLNPAPVYPPVYPTTTTTGFYGPSITQPIRPSISLVGYQPGYQTGYQPGYQTGYQTGYRPTYIGATTYPGYNGRVSVGGVNNIGYGVQTLTGGYTTLPTTGYTTAINTAPYYGRTSNLNIINTGRRSISYTTGVPATTILPRASYSYTAGTIAPAFTTFGTQSIVAPQTQIINAAPIRISQTASRVALPVQTIAPSTSNIRYSHSYTAVPTTTQTIVAPTTYTTAPTTGIRYSHSYTTVPTTTQTIVAPTTYTTAPTTGIRYSHSYTAAPAVTGSTYTIAPTTTVTGSTYTTAPTTVRYSRTYTTAPTTTVTGASYTVAPSTINGTTTGFRSSQFIDSGAYAAGQVANLGSSTVIQGVKTSTYTPSATQNLLNSDGSVRVI